MTLSLNDIMYGAISITILISMTTQITGISETMWTGNRSWLALAILQCILHSTGINNDLCAQY
jgi:hypothetical protein